MWQKYKFPNHARIVNHSRIVTRTQRMPGRLGVFSFRLAFHLNGSLGVSAAVMLHSTKYYLHVRSHLLP